MTITYLLLGLIIIALIVILFIVRRGSKNKSDNNVDKVVGLSSDDSLIKKYKDTAQSQLDYLISFMDEHDKHDTLFRYAVKSKFEEGKEAEHMWTQVF